MTAWVVSPHLLVAQAVTAALTSAGADVESHAWETMVRDAEAGGSVPGTRHVVALFDDLDGLTVVDEIAQLVARGDVRVAVVTSPSAAVMWGGLVEGGAVDVVTVAASVGELAGLLQRFLAGERLMEPEGRRALRAAWVEALDRRKELISLMRTLSPQQLRVLELLASGQRVTEAAKIMGVADGTVRSHVKALRAKLGAQTQLEAVAMLQQVHEYIDRSVLVPRPRGAPTVEQQAVEGTAGGTTPTPR
jgi:DNA-binding NarL/FixJ family response regulator